MSFPAYPSYRKSGVAWLGVVPSDWRIVRLKTMLAEVDERVGGQDAELLGLSKSAGVVRRSELTQGAAESNDYSKYKLVRPGQLVMNKMQAWNGVFSISSLSGMVSPDYSVFDFLEPRFDQLLCAALRTDLAAGELYTRCRGMGTAFLRLNTGDLLDVKVALPPDDDVPSIAAFLDRETAKIDALVEEQRRLIELLKEKRQAVISHAVTKGLDPNVPVKDSGVEWLGDVPAHWEVRRLRFLCKIGTGDGDTADAVDGGAYPFFVRSPIVERIDRYTHDCEAVLTAGDGAGVGKVYHHFQGQFRAHQRVYVFSDFDEVLGRFFYLYMSEMFAKVVLEGTAKSTVESLRRPMIADFWMTVPPEAEQREILAALEQAAVRLDALTVEAESAINLLRERRAALVSAAVTGKIDVRAVAQQQAEAA